MNKQKALFVLLATMVGWGIYYGFFYASIDDRLAKGIEIVSGFFMILVFVVVHLIARFVWRNSKAEKAVEFQLFGFPLPQVNVLTGALLFFGALAFGSGINDMRNVMASMSWPSTAGTVTDVAITDATQDVPSDDASRNVGSTTRQITSYWLKIQYEYEIRGQHYIGNRARFGSPLGGRADEATEALNLHPVGKRVTVFYDPKNAEEAVLYRDIEKGVIFITIVGALTLMAGIALVVVRLKRKFA